MVRLIEVVNTTQYNSRHERVAIPAFTLQELWINEQHVVNLRRASGYNRLLQEGRLPNELDGAHEFTAITTLTGGVQEVYVVVGDLPAVARKVSVEKPTLLKG
jgi:hypothetical protein